jgi:hypothetical protein
MRAAADDAGLAGATVTIDPVDVGLDDPQRIVRHRLGVPQNAWFLDGLSPSRRAALVDAAVAAVTELDEPFRPSVVELRADVR